MKKRMNETERMINKWWKKGLMKKREGWIKNEVKREWIKDDIKNYE